MIPSMDWEERKQFYDEHYHTTYSGHVTAEGVPSATTEISVAGATILYDLFHPKSVLDCGCATGSLLHGFLNLGKEIQVAGFDISKFVVEHSYPDLDGKLSVIDINDGLFYDDEQFDLVFSIDLLEHLQDYDSIVFAAKEMVRVSKKWILIRTPMVRWIDFETQVEIFEWLSTLNSLSHKVRLTLPGIAKQIVDTVPATINQEHPNEHPRQFWLALFESLGCQEHELPEETYRMPNVVCFHSYDVLAFEKG